MMDVVEMVWHGVVWCVCVYFYCFPFILYFKDNRISTRVLVYVQCACTFVNYVIPPHRHTMACSSEKENRF